MDISYIGGNGQESGVISQLSNECGMEDNLSILNSEIEEQSTSVPSQAWKMPDVHSLVFQYPAPFYLFSFTKWWCWGQARITLLIQ